MHIFDLIENFNPKNKDELIKELNNDNNYKNNYKNNYNIFTYSSLKNNGSLQIIVEYFLNNDKKMIYTKDLNGNNSLHIACKNCNYRNIKFLLENDFNPNTKDKIGNSCLLLLISNFHNKDKEFLMKLVYLLNNYGAEFDNLMDFCIINKYRCLIIYLLQKRVEISNYAKLFFRNNNEYNSYIFRYYIIKDSRKDDYFIYLKKIYKENFKLREKIYRNMLIYKLNL